ncbi:MAG: T9SS C-terminal target domain-containing protein [Bacteroidetes bacterium]|nr:MAG: T9SS C-terminal target domain-containing protein [Bacteroidota bacterium]
MSLFFISIEKGKAQTQLLYYVDVAEPSKACPTTTQTYVAKSFFQGGIPVSGTITWYVYASNQTGITKTIVDNGNTSTATINVGNSVQNIRVEAKFEGAGIPTKSSVWTSVETFTPPQPRLLNGERPFWCQSEVGTAKQVTLALGNINTANFCYYHYEYTWRVPTGWKVYGNPSEETFATNTYFNHAETVYVKPPANVTLSADDVMAEYFISAETNWLNPQWNKKSTSYVWIGEPAPVYLINASEGDSGNSDSVLNYCLGQVITFNAYTGSGINTMTNFEWSFPEATFLQITNSAEGENSSSSTLYAMPTVAGTYTIKVRAYNQCSANPPEVPAWKTRTIVINNCTSNGGGPYTGVTPFSYPNAANQSFKAAWRNAQGQIRQENFATPYTLELVNKYGQVKRQATTTLSEFEIETATLPEGLYHLRITTPQGVKNRQVIIKH